MTNWTSADSATRERFERAVINYNQGSGTGIVLLQKYIDRVVQFLTIREMGLLAVLDRRQGSGPAAYVNRRTDAVGGLWADDQTDPTEVVGTFAQAEFPYQTLKTRGSVSRKMQAIGQSYIDILAMEMAGKAEDFASALESGLIWGQFATATKEPMGLVTLIQTANRSSATALLEGDHIINNTTGQTAVASNNWLFPLSLANLDKAIDAVKGSAMRSDLVIVGSFAGIRQVNAALQSQQQFVNETEIAAGFRVRTYDGIPLIVSSEISDAEIVADSSIGASKQGHIISRSSATHEGTHLMIINRRHTFISELTPTTILPLAKTTSNMDSFDMYWDGAPVLANTYGMSMLTNLSATGEIQVV